MQRRSAVTRMAATLAGLSLAELSELEPVMASEGEPFSLTPASLAHGSGVVTCPGCQEMSDSLQLTPAGLCLLCADRNPAVRATPRSHPFWALSPRQVQRLEREIQRLAAELDRMDSRLAELQGQIASGPVFDRAVEAVRDEWHALQRELHLLHLLRAASRQFA